MKKVLLLLPTIALLWVGCKKDDGTETPETPKLVDKVSWVRYADDQKKEGAVTSFTYDASNRVTKIKTEYGDFDPLAGESYEITLAYSGNQVTVVEKEVDENDEYTTTSVLTLDANGHVISGTSNEIWVIDGETEDPEIESWTATYNDGYLKQTAYEDEDGSHASKRTFDFTWSAGNLTRVAYTSFHDETTSLYFAGLKYGSQTNHPDCNLDLNYAIVSNEWVSFSMLPVILPSLGFYGKSSGKLMTESSHYTDTTQDETDNTYTWELDSEGFVTKATQRSINYSNNYAVYTITYTK
jgi:hypothetical protein